MGILLEVGVARFPSAFSMRAEIDETRDFAILSAGLKPGHYIIFDCTEKSLRKRKGTLAFFSRLIFEIRVNKCQ